MILDCVCVFLPCPVLSNRSSPTLLLSQCLASTLYSAWCSLCIFLSSPQTPPHPHTDCVLHNTHTQTHTNKYTVHSVFKLAVLWMSILYISVKTFFNKQNTHPKYKHTYAHWPPLSPKVFSVSGCLKRHYTHHLLDDNNHRQNWNYTSDHTHGPNTLLQECWF